MLTSLQSGAELFYGNDDYEICSSGSVGKFRITAGYRKAVETYPLSKIILLYTRHIWR